MYRLYILHEVFPMLFI